MNRFAACCWTLLLLVVSPAGAAEPSLVKTDLWEAGKDGYALYRIPGIVVTPKGSVLAYCEARRTGKSDWDTIDILLRRSTDGGKTFDKPRKIAEVPGPHKKNPVALAQKLANADDVTYNNAVAIPDRRTGAIHFLFCLEYTRCFYQRSDDDGQTFSKPIEITEAFEAFRKDYDWKVLATGPAHGIQLRNGRLVVPVWLSTGAGGHGHRPSMTSVICSDDAGKTWKRGDIAVPNTAKFVNPNETVVAQLADGRVVLNVRSESQAHRRIVTTSADGATNWSEPKFHDELLESICMGSICRLSEKPAGDKNRLLFANPHNLESRPGQAEKPGSPRERKNLSVKLSYDEGQTWPVNRALEPGVSGYSDLAVLPDGTILCLYERGATDGKTSTRTQFLTLARFNLEWLTEGKDKLAANVPQNVDGRSYDVVVVGATPGGIATAVRAAREGLDVLLVTHSRHLGGMLAEGLGVWDTQYEGRRAPLYDELRAAILDHYRWRYGDNSAEYRDALPGKSGHSNGKFEASVAEDLITAMVAREPRIRVLKGYYPVKAGREGALLRSITLQEMDGKDSITVQGSVFADGTYEGDLAAVAGVPCRLGREARSEFNEPHAGKVFLKTVTSPNEAQRKLADLHDLLKLRPFAGWQEVLPESTGAADGNVQAFNFRTILTSDPNNRVLPAKPADYDAKQAKAHAASLPVYVKTLQSGFGGMLLVPNRKMGLNRPQLVGPHQSYVEGDWAARRRVGELHQNATLAALWYIQNDPSVPEATRTAWRQWGLPKDEFTDNGHFPRELYVREARRIVGRAVFTQHDAMLATGLGRAPVHDDSIAVTEWYLDTHACTTDRQRDSLHDGKMMLHHETFPGQVPYRCLLAREFDNLLVPVCLSATHVAWGTVRLEPTWMHIGEAAGFAAAQALANKQTPAAIDVERLQRTLAERRVMLGFFNDVEVAGDAAYVPALEFFAAKGFFPGYDARPAAALDAATAKQWAAGFTRLAAGQHDAGALARALHALPPGGEAIRAGQFAELLTPAAGGRLAALQLDAGVGIGRGDACRLMFDLLATTSNRSNADPGK